MFRRIFLSDINLNRFVGVTNSEADLEFRKTLYLNCTLVLNFQLWT